jgi:hypothetical protein
MSGQAPNQSLGSAEIQQALWLQVKRLGNRFRGSTKSRRKAAARDFQEALRIFNYFIVEHRLPKNEAD